MGADEYAELFAYLAEVKWFERKSDRQDWRDVLLTKIAFRVGQQIRLKEKFADLLPDEMKPAAPEKLATDRRAAEKRIREFAAKKRAAKKG